LPLYDYDCEACGRRFEVIHGVHAAPPSSCPTCGSDRVRKAIAAPAIHFKGSGWAKKERRATTTKAPASAGSDEGATGDAAAGAPDAPAPATGSSPASDGGAGSASPPASSTTARD
jgi:putative FmdB family regulatory protein